jgi:Mg/Co/Ni transporter MgtE
VYVCRPPTETPTGRYLGIAHFQRLLREPPSTLVGAVADTGIEPLRPETSLRAVTGHLATYNLVAAPVVDADDHLLGAVTVDDVLDHLLPEDWRDHPVENDEEWAGGTHAS